MYVSSPYCEVLFHLIVRIIYFFYWIRSSLLSFHYTCTMRRNCCVYLSADSSPSLLSCSGAGRGLGNNVTGPESHREAGGGKGAQTLDLWIMVSGERTRCSVALSPSALPTELSRPRMN